MTTTTATATRICHTCGRDAIMSSGHHFGYIRDLAGRVWCGPCWAKNRPTYHDSIPAPMTGEEPQCPGFEDPCDECERQECMSHPEYDPDECDNYRPGRTRDQVQTSVQTHVQT